MPHSLTLTDSTYGGSPATTVTITLTSTSTGYLQSYTPATPTISVSELTSMLQDGGDLTNARLQNVTESAVVTLVAATGALLQALINDIELLFRTAERYHRTGVGRATWVEVQMTSDTQTWRSEILTGRLELNETAWPLWSNNKADVTLYWTRRYYWEETTETSVNKATAQTSRTTGAVRISNDPTNCYIDINAADLSKGSLPAPAYLELANVSGASVSLVKMHIGQYAEHAAFDDDALTLAYEAEDAQEVATNVTRTVTGDSTGTHTGANNQPVIVTDSTKSWTVNEHVGKKLRNITDGSSGIVVSNSVTAAQVDALTGGTENDFDTGDTYVIGGFQFHNGFYGSIAWTSSALASSTRVLQWTITGANVTKMAGRYFRVLARFLGTPDTDTLATVKVEWSSGTPTAAIYSSSEVRLTATQLQDLGAIRVLPVPKTLYFGETATSLALTLWLRDANATGTLLLDYLFLLPLDSYRELDFQAAGAPAILNNEVIVDNVYFEEAYVLGSGVTIYPVVVPKAGPIWLWPDKDQRIYFHEVATGGMTIGDDYDATIKYRPRRLTV